MDEKLLLQLAQVMGGPNGRGAPLRDESIGILEAGLSGVPTDSNDGRNRVKGDEMEANVIRFRRAFMDKLKNGMASPTPTPALSLTDEFLLALAKSAAETAAFKWRDMTRLPLVGSDPEGGDTRPQSPDIAKASGDK